ncbi:MAG: DsrE family protein [Gammaproteobacteria bacterium]|nr:DsrE family protein [Gammaproteobacteria bacterium]
MITLKTTTLTTLLLTIALFVSGCTTTGGTGYSAQKVVYHINYDDPKMQAGALRNIQNHINAVGKENMDMKVVLHGKGLSLLLEPESVANTKLKLGNATDEMQVKISSLKEQKVVFNVCANTLKGKNIKYDSDLYDVSAADIVPSGVAELAHLQSMGYTYIKP